VLVVTGVFENERFVPDKPISLPQKKRVIVTIEEENEHINLSFKELAEQAKAVRARLMAETGIINVKTLIRDGRNR